MFISSGWMFVFVESYVFNERTKVMIIQLNTIFFKKKNHHKRAVISNFLLIKLKWILISAQNTMKSEKLSLIVDSYRIV